MEAVSRSSSNPEGIDELPFLNCHWTWKTRETLIKKASKGGASTVTVMDRETRRSQSTGGRYCEGCPRCTDDPSQMCKQPHPQYRNLHPVCRRCGHCVLRGKHSDDTSDLTYETGPKVRVPFNPSGNTWKANLHGTLSNNTKQIDSPARNPHENSQPLSRGLGNHEIRVMVNYLEGDLSGLTLSIYRVIDPPWERGETSNIRFQLRSQSP